MYEVYLEGRAQSTPGPPPNQTRDEQAGWDWRSQLTAPRNPPLPPSETEDYIMLHERRGN